MIKGLIERSVQYSTIFFTKRPSTTHKLSNCKKNLPMDPTSTIQHDEEEIRSRARMLCSKHLGGAWSKVCPDEISLLPVSGGLSNLLFCCSLPESTNLDNDEPSQVLLRFYGDHSRNCDISLQLEVFNLLSQKELGPKLYGTFEDGRLEEFLPADSLTCDELMNDEISSVIARKIAAIHSLDVPIDKNKTWLKERLEEWISYIKDQKEPDFDETTRQSTKEIAKELLAIDFDRELNFLLCEFEKSSSPIVFSHNDLHQGNILLAKSSKRRPTFTERIVPIDFEYCSYNYRAYDIANHFCEWCFEYDTPEYPHFKSMLERFPSSDTQRRFVTCYLNKRYDIINKTKSKTNGATNHHHLQTNNGPTNGHSNGFSEDKSEQDVLLNEIKTFTMAANFLWTLWCIKGAYNSSISFGYWEHAMARWKFYSTSKADYKSCLHEPL